MKTEIFGFWILSQQRLHGIISTLNPHAQEVWPSYWSANKIRRFCLLPFTLLSSSSRLLFLYRLIFSPSPLNHIPSAPYPLCISSALSALLTWLISGFPHHFPKKPPWKLKASPSSLAPPWVHLSSRRRANSLFKQAKPDLQLPHQRVLTGVLRDHRICNGAREDGDFSVPKAQQHPCLLAKQSYFSHVPSSSVPAAPLRHYPWELTFSQH